MGRRSTDASPSSPARVAASVASTRCCSRPKAPRSSSTTSAAPSTGAPTSRRPSRWSDEIKAMGGEAVANGDNVADWEGGQRLVQRAIDAFGDLDILVNNAGILRDRVLVNMTEDEWDAVIAVHLKGHFCPTRHAAAYWRSRRRPAKRSRPAVINTSSTSGLLGNPGQTNYGAAKSGIATFSQIIGAGAGPLRREEQHHRPGGCTGSPRRRPAWGTSSSRRKGGSTRGTRRTSRRSSPTSPPPTVPSPARRSSCRAA